MIPFGLNDVDMIWREAMDRYLAITRNLRTRDRRYKAWEKRADEFCALTRQVKEDLRREAFRCREVDANGPTTRPGRRAGGWLY